MQRATPTRKTLEILEGVILVRNSVWTTGSQVSIVH